MKPKTKRKTGKKRKNFKEKLKEKRGVTFLQKNEKKRWKKIFYDHQFYVFTNTIYLLNY